MNKFTHKRSQKLSTWVVLLRRCRDLRLLAIVFFAIYGCGEQKASDSTDSTTTTRFTLVESKDCQDVEANLRKVLLEDVKESLEEEFERVFDDKDSETNYCFNGSWEYGRQNQIKARGGIAVPLATTSGAALESAAADTADEGGSATSSSSTNNQVEGVDEADIVKHDGKYLYVIDDAGFKIIDGYPANDAHTVASIDVDGVPKKLFLKDDRLLVFVGLDKNRSKSTDVARSNISAGYEPRECTYAYDCDFAGDGFDTGVLVYDVSDKSNPQLIREIESNGSLLAARLIGSSVFVALTHPAPFVDGLRIGPSHDFFQQYKIQGRWREFQDNDGTLQRRWTTTKCKPLTNKIRKEILTAFDDIRDENEEKVELAELSEFLPNISDRIGEDMRSSVTTECEGYLKSSLSDGAQFTSVIGLNIKNTEQRVTESVVVSRPGIVSASDDALYLAVRHSRSPYRSWFNGDDQSDYEEELSTIHKFSLDVDSALVQYVASGAVEGHLLNQFALDQYDGHVRVASSSGRVPDPNVHSQITVLKHDERNLVEVGKLDDIARDKKEDIRAVRFKGDRGYIVTFKKTDPLFYFDLEDHENPKQIAEILIPGFATYIHMLDDDHIMTVGYDADDQGDFAYFTGIKLQIFDVNNPAAPTGSFVKTIGARGSSSEALTNHLAFTFYEEAGKLALPMTVCDGASQDLWGAEPVFSGLKIFDVNAATGFSDFGEISHGLNNGEHCGNWWTKATSTVRRSLFLDNYVYSIARDKILIDDIDSLDDGPLSEIKLSLGRK